MAAAKRLLKVIAEENKGFSPQLLGEYCMVEMSKIRVAEFNPEGRTETDVATLMESIISARGLYAPVLLARGLDGFFELIDGHRRHDIHVRLGSEWIQAIVHDVDQEYAYGIIQATTAKMTGKQTLGVYLANAHALTPAKRKKFAAAERVCGRRSLQEIHESNCTLSVFDNALNIFRYTERQHKIQSIISWILKNPGMLRQARDMIKKGDDASKFDRPIRENKPLRVETTVLG
jgi:hypothetical protein